MTQFANGWKVVVHVSGNEDSSMESSLVCRDPLVDPYTREIECTVYPREPDSIEGVVTGIGWMALLFCFLVLVQLSRYKLGKISESELGWNNSDGSVALISFISCTLFAIAWIGDLFD